MRGPVDGHEADFVRGSDAGPGLDAAARQPDRETGTIVLAAILALDHGSAAEFAAANHQRGIEQAGLLQVGQQCGHGLIYDLSVGLVIFPEVAMRIPTILFVHVIDLDKTHPPFHQPPREQALAGILRGIFVRMIQPVTAADGFGLPFQVAHFKGGRLHPPAKFIAGDAGIERGVTGAAGAVMQIQLSEHIERLTLARGKLLRRQQVSDGRPGIAQPGALEGRGQKAIAVIRGASERAGFKQEHVGGEVTVFRSQPISHPRAEAGFTPGGFAGVELDAGGAVIVAVGLHRVDQAEVVRMFG